MRFSEYLVPTLREVPAEAEIVSHQLLLRAGFIRKAASGVYTYLPLAFRVLARIKAIVREEMDRAGGQEIGLPIIQPAELWLESGRWNVYGPELFRLKDRHGRDFCLGPTHEEIITELVKGDLRSYKQLPLLIYQIQNKYRDERRPRFGLMRGREFIMKDLYSFDRDEAGLDASYRKMYDAYTRIFERCGLEFRPVEADSGPIGGSVSHEFMVLADSGEGTVVYCPDAGCGYAANIEKAIGRPALSGADEELAPREEVVTPGLKTVDQVTAFLGVGAERLVKTLLYEAPDGVVAALVRGDREVNEIKLQNLIGVDQLEMADAEIVRRVTRAPVGFTGPVGLDVETIVADEEVMVMVNCITGANKADTHYRNVNPGRDFKPDLTADIRVVDDGQVCARCGAVLQSRRGIEVGQVFKLGIKYSKSLHLTYLDEQGEERLVVMGCYGIGVSRTMAAAVEQNYDADGIIWPVSIAPVKVVVVPVNMKEQTQVELAERVYRDLWAAGIDAMLDDRAERPGVKFKDADLVGYPVRVTVGKKAVDGEVEVLRRRTREMQVVPVKELVEAVKKVLAEG
ncbi:MAG: proline--tRNA ligase [Eubacteriales bacterium]|nr:proline--tRNA ligase [Bacillota bacterium]MBV1727841.1 proline--tRNA ligase [Desulforudis sp.]MDQ7789844.1 proline--tRNA ligase [Clostridia bacterium]MDZ4043413.1 proline--tRNA ligase [Eubacteriales bacterium]MBU4532285.1 proline--tRNA ligase [Bacillota bacterium]